MGLVEYEGMGKHHNKICGFLPCREATCVHMLHERDHRGPERERMDDSKAH